KQLDPAVVAERLAPFLEAKGVKKGDPRLPKLVAVLRARARTLQEVADMAGGVFSGGVGGGGGGGRKDPEGAGAAGAGGGGGALEGLGEWSVAALDEEIKQVSEKMKVGMGKVAQPVRVAVTGGTASPGIGETLELVGKEQTLKRIDAALARTT